MATEIESGPAADVACLWLRGPGASHLRKVGETPEEIAGWDLGRGESEVLAWARENPGHVAVLDDRAARRCAEILNVPLIGTVGILMRAKRQGLLGNLAVALDDAGKAGLYPGYFTAMKIFFREISVCPAGRAIPRLRDRGQPRQGRPDRANISHL